MAASYKSLKEIRELNDKRLKHDTAAVHKWNKLIEKYELEESTQVDPHAKDDDLRDLIEKLAKFRDEQIEEGEQQDDCGGGSPCSDGGSEGPKTAAEIDLEDLAELVFRRLIFEARVERERAGWTV